MRKVILLLLIACGCRNSEYVPPEPTVNIKFEETFGSPGKLNLVVTHYNEYRSSLKINLSTEESIASYIKKLEFTISRLEEAKEKLKEIEDEPT